MPSGEQEKLLCFCCHAIINPPRHTPFPLSCPASVAVADDDDYELSLAISFRELSVPRITGTCLVPVVLTEVE